MSKIVKSPGEFLSEMLQKRNISSLRLSKDIQLSQSAVRLVVLGKTRISVPVALRLAKYFNTNPEYWLDMQMRWDLAEAVQDRKLMDIVNKITRFQKEQGVAKKPATGRATAAKSAAVKKPVAKKAAAVKKPVADKKPAAAKTAAAKKGTAKTPAAGAKKPSGGRGRAAK